MEAIVNLIVDFNPRSHERSDDSWLRYMVQKIAISIHAPTRGATDKSILWSRSIRFQSTLPREERQVSSVTTCLPTNFNPRSHERSDFFPNIDIPDVAGFQSTLPREERRCSFQTISIICNFNPRSHERSDISGLNTRDIISIFQSTLPREERPAWQMVKAYR